MMICRQNSYLSVLSSENYRLQNLPIQMPNTQNNAPSGNKKKANRQKKREASAKGALMVERSMARAASRVNSQVISRAKGSGMMLTRHFALPTEHDLVRIPTSDMARTTPLLLRQRIDFSEVSTITMPASAGGNGANLTCFMYGLPCLSALIGPFALSTGGTSVTTFYFSDAVSPRVVSWKLPWGAGATNSIRGTPSNWPLTDNIVTTNLSTSYPLGCPKRPIMMHDSKNFIFLNVGEQFDLTVTPDADPTAVGRWSFVLYRYTYDETDAYPESVVEITTTGTTANSSAMVPAYSGWYSVEFQGVNATIANIMGGNVSLVLRTPVNVYGWHLKYPDTLLTTPSIGALCRRTAQTILLTNMSSDLNAQGSIIANRNLTAQPGQLNWTSQLASLKDTRDFCTERAKNGCYSYMDFSAHAEPFRPYLNDLGCPIFRSTDFAMLMHVISVNNGALSTSPNTYAITLCTAIEFQSQSQLFSADVPHLEFDQLIQARRINNDTPYFYENPIHWGVIAKHIRQAWQGFQKVSPYLQGGLSVLFPEAAPALSVAGRAVRALPS